MSHGFMTRGDLSDEKVMSDTSDGWKRLLAFFEKCFKKATKKAPEGQEKTGLASVRLVTSDVYQDNASPEQNKLEN